MLEKFQWLTEEESRDLSSDDFSDVREEVADVLLYLVRLSDKVGIDLIDAAREKLEKNGQKYPVDQARGSRIKYTKLPRAKK